MEGIPLGIFLSLALLTARFYSKNSLLLKITSCNWIISLYCGMDKIQSIIFIGYDNSVLTKVIAEI